jgi:hypothetical protein
VKIQKVLQYMGGADQFGVEFLGEGIVRRVLVGYIDAAFQIIVREDSDFFGE